MASVPVVQNILKLLNIETEEISFKRQEISNDTETVQAIYMMRQDIDRETALKLNPYIVQDDIQTIMSNLDAEEISGLSGMDALQRVIDEQRQDE